MQWLPLSRHTAQTSLGTTRFFPSIYLPHLLHMIPCSYWALSCLADLPSCTAFYTISVRQTRDLPVVSLFPHPASFRFHLTMDTLAFSYILPTTGRIRDLHPLETCAARRTNREKLDTAMYRAFFINLLSRIVSQKSGMPLRARLYSIRSRSAGWAAAAADLA